MPRLRMCMPLPQDLLQDDQEDHEESAQSLGNPLAQAGGASSFGDGLQGQVCFNAPSQNLPWPAPNSEMRRDRRMMPPHVAEQALHADHSVNLQSRSGSQAMPWLQKFTSWASPVAGAPQASAILAI
mmetsp:Transcript_56343/g.111984  ORF Transcript_56343/g.111984 Transcript_56343/m.111984 type:complete len:127 (-) Transcript_56343:1515-1895(-)|eukprot:CAMPEP_0172791196 /NCGR_PEP_ID=MMETSP1074-20121228/208347_1 /TAXON_ID=2916 /ORGANISM="Ceratium fusus, Strain PA161109" /LENGTH=126 /DNA_ID=CAMNT_0013628253 /DNA_START=810 /DNA_END=1190 /DNA_ORIENTATION=-